MKQFLLAHTGARHGMRLLSLPGRWWTLERELAKELNAQCVGFEWNLETLIRGRPYMPGKRPHEITHEFLDGQILAYARSQSTALHCNVGHFLSLRRLETSYNRRTWKEFILRFGRYSAVWLDYTSQICEEVRLGLQNLGRHLARKRKCIPVAISVMACRDRINSNDGTRKLPTKVPQARMHYQSLETIRRETMIGRDLNRSSLFQFELDGSFTSITSKTPMLTTLWLAIRKD